MDSSETSLVKDGTSSPIFGDLSHIPFPPIPNQSSPTHSLIEHEAERQSFVSLSEHDNESHCEETEVGIEQQDHAIGFDSLEVPDLRPPSSPYGTQKGPHYHLSTLSDNTEALEVSLNIPDFPNSHSEISVSHDSLHLGSEHQFTIAVGEQEENNIMEYLDNVSGQETSVHVSTHSQSFQPVTLKAVHDVNVIGSSEQHSVNETSYLSSSGGDLRDGQSERKGLEKQLSAGQLV